MDRLKGQWLNEREHQKHLSKRRAAYRKAHPRPIDSLVDEAAEAAEAAPKRDSRLRVWQFTCNSGLRLNWASAGIADLKRYFEDYDNVSTLFMGLLGFKYCFYRVSVDGDFLRGYVILKRTTMGQLSSAAPNLDFHSALTHRYALDQWVADPKLAACGRFYMAGTRPKYL